MSEIDERLKFTYVPGPKDAVTCCVCGRTAMKRFTGVSTDFGRIYPVMDWPADWGRISVSSYGTENRRETYVVNGPCCPKCLIGLQVQHEKVAGAK